MAVNSLTDKDAFDALYHLHQTNPDILVSNGFLENIRDNDELLDSLSADEREFFDKSLTKHETDITLAIAAAEEGNTALIEAEQRTAQLVEAKAESDRLRIEADAAKQQAEESRDDIAKELEQAAQYQIQSDRQRRQFKTVQAHGYPAWSLLFILVIGVILLFWFEKPGVEVLVTVLAGVLGSTYQSFTSGFNAMFSPIVKEEKKPDSKSHGCKAND